MRNTSKYLHNLTTYQALDQANAQLACATSLVNHADARTLIALDTIAHVTRARDARRAKREIASGNAFTAEERAWFRRPINATEGK